MILKPWTSEHKKRYTTLFNYINKNYTTLYKINKDDYIFKTEADLKDIVINAPWADGTKENLFFMIGRFLENNGRLDEAKKFLNDGYALKIKNDIKESENKRDDKEKNNYISMYELKQKIFLIKELHQESTEQHFKYLLLNLITLQPPLRANFYYTAKFIKSQHEDDGKNNFILLENGNGYYIVNSDKVSNNKYYKQNQHLKKIQLDHDLTNILIESLEFLKRNYLFEYNNRPFTSKKLLNLLRTATGKDKINFNMLRSIFITHYYKKNKSLKDAATLAAKMRHSTNTARKNYYKVDDKETKEETAENDNLLLININNLNDEINKLQNELKQNKHIEPRAASDENKKLFNKRRNDAVYKIKKGIKPRQKTIEKYNINLEEIKNNSGVIDFN